MENSKVIGVLIGGIGLGAAIGGSLAMKFGKKSNLASNSSSETTCSIAGATPNSAIFELDGKAYASDDFPSEAKDVLYQIQNQSFEGTANFSKELALRISLAKEAGNTDIANLPPLKTLLKADKISDEEMKKFYEANKQSIPPGTTFEQIRPQLEQFMQGQKIAEQTRSKAAELEQKGRFKFLASAPMAPVVTFDLAPYPSRGASASKVTLVEVSDYLCPHCRSTQTEVDAVLKEFDGKVKFVQINYALHPEGLSGMLARGGFCANKQGSEQFWKYHEKAFGVSLDLAKPKGADAAKEFTETSIAVAKESGIDAAQFEKCLISEESKKAMEDASTAMSNVGVKGTPTFFLNNRKVGMAAGGLAAAVRKEIDSPKAN